MNKVILFGRLTKDIELKKTSNGISTCSFTVAINRRKTKDADKAEADFINCVAWRGSAEYLADYGNKGDLVSVEGRIQTRNYDGSDGKRVYITEVIVENVSILSYTKSSQTTNNESNTNNSLYEQESNSVWNSDVDLSSKDLPF